MEEKSLDSICDFLEGKGYPDSVVEAFRGKNVTTLLLLLCQLILDEELDGQAVAAGLASSIGSDWLKDIIPKVGLRLKLHQSLNSLAQEECPVSQVSYCYLYAAGKFSH